MFIKRDIENSILNGAKQVPVVAVVGPRQSGKSTLVRELFPNHTFLDMQDAELHKHATDDPKEFLSAYANDHGIIIDEAQYVPHLFSQIKVEADRNPQPGYFILSGSQNFLLHTQINESLAGRVYFYILLPLSMHELESQKLLLPNVKDQIIRGFYPRVFKPLIDPKEYYVNYIATYVERDIRTLRNIENIIAFQNFIKICALRIGCTLNYTDLANDAGISVATAKNWLSLLHASYILFLLPAYYNNLNKRITKSPKLYFYDVGLACSLMAIDKAALIKQRLLYGAVFENLVICDLIKNLNADNTRYILTFYRDENKKEIDLILETSGKTIPIEIKSSESVHSEFFDTAIWFNEEIKNDQEPIVIYGGDQMQKRTKGKAYTWKQVEKILDF